LIGIEPAYRMHQSQLTLAGQIVPRQAGRAMNLRQLNDDTPVAFGELAGGRDIVSVSPAMTQGRIRGVFEVAPSGAAPRWAGVCGESTEVHGRAPFSQMASPGLRVALAYMICPIDAVGLRPATRRRSGNASTSFIHTGI